MPKLEGFPSGMVPKLVENTELHVQQLFNESYRETGMGPQGLAGVELCVYINSTAGNSVVFLLTLFLSIDNYGERYFEKRKRLYLED